MYHVGLFSKKKKKLQDILKDNTFEETNQASEADSDMTETLALSNLKSKLTMINMPKVLVEKVGNMQQQLGYAGKEIKVLRINRKC